MFLFLFVTLFALVFEFFEFLNRVETRSETIGTLRESFALHVAAHDVEFVDDDLIIDRAASVAVDQVLLR